MDINHEGKNIRLAKNILIIGVGTVFARLISFVMTPFFSSWLSTSDYGKYDLIASYVSLCVPLVTLQLDQGIYRFSMEKKEFSSYYYRIILKFMLMTSVFSSVFVYIFMKVNGFENSLIMCFLAYFISLAFFNIIAEYLRGNDNLVAYSSLSISTGALTVLLSIIIVKILNYGVEGLLLVFALSYGITFSVAQLIYKPFKRSNTDGTTIKQLLKYSIPLIPNNISWWITNVSDRTLITLILSSYSNGIYAICCKIPTMLSIVFGIFNLSFQQIALDNTPLESQKKYFDMLILKVISVLFFGSIMIVSLTPILYLFFLKPDYSKGIACVPVLLCGAVFLSIAQYLGDILLVKKETKWIGISTVFAAVANIIMNIFMIPLYGILGAAIATMISYIIMLAIRLYANRIIFSCGNIIIKLIVYGLIYWSFSTLVIMFYTNIIIVICTIILSILLFLCVNKDIVLEIAKKIIKKH